MLSRVTGKSLPLLGGTLCVDFVNTIDPRLKAPREEFLPTYGKFVEWAVFVGLLTKAEGRSLTRWANEHPSAAAVVHRRAIRFREALYCLLRRSDERRCLAAVNRELRRGARDVRLNSDSGTYSTRWQPGFEILGPIIQSAFELLTSPELSHVRMCAGDGCGWLFVDNSRTHRRRWCSMAICGNRAKASRNRRRVRRLVRKNATNAVSHLTVRSR